MEYDAHHHLASTSGKGAHASSASKAAAQRLKDARDAVNARMLSKLQQELAEEEASGSGTSEDIVTTSTLAATRAGLGRPATQHINAPSSASVEAPGAFRAAVDQAQQAVKSVPGVAQAAAQREKEARMLKDWFQAVWPDLGSFRSWGTATRVVSMSGSLTLSLAFAGTVYWLSTKYDSAAGGLQPAKTPAQTEPKTD